MRLIYLTLVGLFVAVTNFNAHSQTVLAAGDIAIVAFNTDDPDQFGFVPLVDLAQGTTVSFTDNGWTGTALTTSEGTFQWTASASITKGTVILINPSSISFSTSGDQLFAYQGAASNPTFIYGLSTRAWVTGSINANTSRRPSSLIVGSTALSFSTERDNGFYNIVSTSGTKSQVLSSISNANNWTRSDSRYSTFPSWQFNLGTGSIEPTVHASNLSFTNVTTYSANFSFSPATNFNGGYLVTRGEASPSAAPVDGVTYTVGSSIGNSKVIAVGTTNAIPQWGLRSGTGYFYRVYTYLGTGSAINYLQLNAPQLQVNTPNNMIGNYYSTVDSTSSLFISQLQNRVRNPYTKVSYDLYDERIVAQYEFRDTLNGQKVQECAYSGQLFSYTPPFVWYTASPFSREHTWCVSWMPSGGITSSDEYADFHHLFTVNQINANGVRSNHPLGEVTNATSTYLNAQYGLDMFGENVYEPRAQQKGDAARALLYMALRYDGVNGFNWDFDYLNTVILPTLNEGPQELSTLLEWHFQDLPDRYEISRNDYIQSIQGNRNPFIDFPTWVNLIDFNTVQVKTAAAPAIAKSLHIEEAFEVSIYPNPSKELCTLSCRNASGLFTCEVFDLSGRLLWTHRQNVEGSAVISLPANDLAPSTYILRTSISGQTKMIKWIKGS